MASTYSTNLALELIGTGDQAGTWGVTTNTNLGTLIEQAISGYVTQAVSTGTDTTITIPNGATGVARNMYIELTGTGGTNTNLIVPANKKLYFIFNNSTGAVTVKVSGQTGVSVPQGKKVVLTSNGTDIVNGLNYIADFGSNSATITQLTATSATITNLTLTSLVISNLSIASANITTLTSASATISTTLALSGGTANGVLYLNASKVATSGSALTFDGTNFATTGRATANDFLATGSAYYATVGGVTYGSLIATGGAGALTLNANNGSNLIFQVASTEGFRLTSSTLYTASGINVGIGTSSPTYKLDVNGQIIGLGTTTASSGAGGQLRFRDDTGSFRWLVGLSGAAATTFQIYDNVASLTRLAIDSSGNLGIGTSSPAAKLHVSNGVNTDSGNFTGLIIGGSDATTARTASLIKNTSTPYDLTIRSQNNTGTTSGSLFFQNGSTTQMTLDSSGNLGIGTTSPGAMLDVAGNARSNAWIGRANGSAPTADAAIYRPADNTLGFSTANTERARITSGGNLLVGTTSGTATVTVNASGGATIRALRESVSATNHIQMEHDGTNGKIAVSGANALLFDTNSTPRARITSGGLFLVNTDNSTSYGNGHRIYRDVSEGGFILSVDGGGEYAALFQDVASGGYSTAAAGIWVGKNSSNSRSINAGGTVNASGTDYAEYMEKAGEFVISKGDVCGVDANGKLTNVYANAVAFVVKSTNPSYVGGDSWGAGYKDDPEGLEAARQKVDRIAFSGQVPVNVLGATPGQYIVPVNDNGAIKGVAVSNPSFEQYQMAIGKVIAIEDDGRARIIVKIA